MVLVLLPYVLVASFQLISFNMPYRLIQRSLPGSLGTAPEGAVGYQQPPGPVINNAQPTVTSATAAQEPAELNGASPVTTNPSNNVAFLTGTVTKTPAVMERTQVAIAGQASQEHCLHPIVSHPLYSTPTITMSLQTPLCSLLKIQHPVLLAGMARASGAPLAAAVSNAGGLGTVGGLGYTPEQLSEMLTELKATLRDPSLPFGVDLALPQIGGGARATNHDYTNGQLDQLIDVVISHGAKLFVSAVGVPPERVIKRLHDAGILIMNMVGAPKHAEKALKLGVDIVCAQGGEGGGHTGDIPFSVLVPAIVDVAKKYKSPLTGQPALVVAAGGINDGRSLAASLMLGAVGVWVGTRFVASEESSASRLHKEAVVGAQFGETKRTLVLSGRPLRMLPNDYIKDWEKRPEEIARLTAKGIVPIEHDFNSDREDIEMPYLMGDVSGIIKEIKPAGVIVQEMVQQAVQMLRVGGSYINAGSASKL
ncbi:Nitronate monooxygenase-domain-containing protein [Aspergillus bertholletiae]|uniref:Nitronate monooxygenase-domain-containing protein n=1 Tax=Aspergillus bertholletiae TaxID=1226010 RepID=A0A5N7BNE0_9EURO|nr:Nitronate monooxygenase-domain-containing protein [Aspergillus bertholletiae]